MAFGQAPGPPATARQVQELLALLHEAGHVDFRDARGPMGFNQRQAGGRFTRDEAAAFIEQLHAAGEEAPTSDRTPSRAAPPRAATRQGATDRLLRDMPAELLAVELRRRGWMVIEPLEGV